MNRKERILSYIASNTYVPLKFKEMATVLNVPHSEENDLKHILDELILEGKIFITKKERYCIVSSQTLTTSGILQCNARGGFAFLRCDNKNDDDIFISGKKLGTAYDGDKVLVRIDEKSTSGFKREGRVISIIQRGNKNIVGIVAKLKNGYYRIVPDNRSFFASVRVLEQHLNGAKKGDRVIVEITKYSEKGKPYGMVTSSLGNAENLLSFLNGFIAEHDIPLCFDKEILDEANKYPDKVTAKEIEEREDLREKIIFTIDGDDSQDFDDAVSLEILKDGNYLLGVHIADVTHYVKEGSPLDKEALKRGTSVYFPHKVIPMLPKKLSNGICSLNPHVDRLTLSVFMKIDNNGNIIEDKISETVIHSSARMTYNDVNKILSGDTTLREKYRDFVPIFENMNTLSAILEKKRELRGAIDFDFPEANIICDDDANPVSVKIDERGRSQRLIESFMLAANETIAETAYWAELPFVYRVHESPSLDKLMAFNNFIKNFNYSLKGKIDSESIHPKDLQQITEKVKGKPEEMMISKELLRSLMKACYKSTNEGHFGLAARFYCHFTSPIRRYPDLMIHRILKEFINSRLTVNKQLYYENKTKIVAEISSEREITAQDAEREAIDLLKTAYMKQFIGESFNAVISSITSFGMFATLANSCEGLIRCENMKGDYFKYDECRHILIGKRTSRVYKIGDVVRITVVACNIIMRNIDFMLECDTQKSLLSATERRNKNIIVKNVRKQRKKKTKQHYFGYKQ